jgi:hypothetical protein
MHRRSPLPRDLHTPGTEIGDQETVATGAVRVELVGSAGLHDQRAAMPRGQIAVPASEHEEIEIAAGEEGLGKFAASPQTGGISGTGSADDAVHQSDVTPFHLLSLELRGLDPVAARASGGGVEVKRFRADGEFDTSRLGPVHDEDPLGEGPRRVDAVGLGEAVVRAGQEHDALAAAEQRLGAFRDRRDEISVGRWMVEEIAGTEDGVDAMPLVEGHTDGVAPRVIAAGFLPGTPSIAFGKPRPKVQIGKEQEPHAISLVV